MRKFLGIELTLDRFNSSYIFHAAVWLCAVIIGLATDDWFVGTKWAIVFVVSNGILLYFLANAFRSSLAKTQANEDKIAKMDIEMSNMDIFLENLEKRHEQLMLTMQEKIAENKILMNRMAATMNQIEHGADDAYHTANALKYRMDEWASRNPTPAWKMEHIPRWKEGEFGQEKCACGMAWGHTGRHRGSKYKVAPKRK